MTRDNLTDRILTAFPHIDLDQHETRWTETERGEALVVNDDLWFEPVGEDIYIVGSIPGTGLLGCLILHPDGRLEFAATRPDPLSSESVKLN